MSAFQLNESIATLDGANQHDEQVSQPKVASVDAISEVAKAHGLNIGEIPDVTILLDGLLSKLSPINFREKSGITDDKTKLTNKHYIVLTVEEALEAASLHSQGMCTENDSTYYYNGCYWQHIDPKRLKYFLGKAAGKLGVEPIDSRWHLFQDHLLKQFLTSAQIANTKKVKGKTLINLINGTFEISSDGQNRLREFSADDFITHQLPFAYDPNAEAPLFHKYLNYVLPDVASQQNIAEYIGSVFINSEDLRLEKVLLMQGGGRNGKSVMQLIIIALLGACNVSNYSLQSLTDQNGYYRAELANKLVNMSAEISNKIGSSIFKQLASGEPVEARSPYGKPFSLRNYGKMIFNCNLLPTEVEQSDGFFDRWMIIEFGRRITDEERDVELPMKIIKNELSGVFNWVLDGLNRLLTQKGFTVNETAKNKLAQFKRQSDSVALFLDDEGYVSDPNEIIVQNDLYKDYSNYCKDLGYHKCSGKVFFSRLENYGVKRERRNVGWVLFMTKKES